ncbi:MAG: hypothetical protein ACLPUO_30160 [Streptosporangiaceae bacterium]
MSANATHQTAMIGWSVGRHQDLPPGGHEELPGQSYADHGM